MAEPLLSVKDLSTHFFTSEGVVRAVNDVSYDVMPGQTLGLVGESGSGKSVSALSLLRLIPNPPGKIVQGEVWFDGEELMSVDDSRMREIRGNEIAMVFQEPMTSLNPVLTIGRQLTEAIELHMGMRRNEANERAIRAAAHGRHSRRRAAAVRLPPPVLGRDAPARDDRNGAVLRPEAAAGRRADHSA